MNAFEEPARLICRGDALPALIQNLEKLGRTISAHRESDARILAPSVVKDELNKLRRAALMIARAAEGGLSVFVDGAATNNKPDWVVLCHHAGMVADLAQTALKSLPEGKKGSKHAIPLASGLVRSGVDARAACAIVIVEAWIQQRKSAPWIDNNNAQDAAAALWRASGGEDLGSTGVNSGWRRWLDIAKKAKSDDSTSDFAAFTRIVKQRLNFSPLPE